MNNAENGKIFRTSFNGYNKDDVNQYIMASDAKNREMIDALSQEKSEAERCLKETAEQAEQLEKMTAQLTEQMEQWKKEAETERT